MKSIIIILALFSNFAFSQKKKENKIEKKICEYITACQSVTDVERIEPLKNNFPNIFRFVPDINPINPKNKPGVSSGFSAKRLHPLYGTLKVHNGVDVTAKLNTPVYASADGIVLKSQFYNGAAGHSVELTHNFGFKTRYFHLSIFIVKNGESVKKGQIIGFLGRSGAVTGPHLHYEIIKNGKYLNPRLFLNIK